MNDIPEGSEYLDCCTAVEFDRVNIRIQDYVKWLIKVKKLSNEEAVAEAKKVYFIK